MKWQIYLYGIVWDDGKGEYEVSENPENLRVTVEIPGEELTKSEAIERALEIATDEFGALIEGTEQIMATQVA